MKELLILDFDLKHVDNLVSLLDSSVHCFNNDRPAYALCPVQNEQDRAFDVF